MRTIILILSFIYLAHSFSIHEKLLDEWRSFKIQHGKNYESNEDEARLLVFLENRKKIVDHNRRFEMGLVTYTMAMNQFGDMSDQEYLEMIGLNKMARGDTKSNASVFLEPANVKIPEELNWHKIGAVTPVKNQGQCGSCWAFSATGSLEGQLFRRDGRLVSLSEQNLMDCSVSYGNNGCRGGLMTQAFEYIKANGGLDTEDSYPYEGRMRSCRYNPANSAVDVSGYVELNSGNEDKLQYALASVGPISVAIQATDTLKFYSAGVYYEPGCSADGLNHGVLSVGYGEDSQTGLSYWLVKNSWGEWWGNNGYVKMVRNKDNHCGIASLASYPLLR